MAIETKDAASYGEWLGVANSIPNVDKDFLGELGKRAPKQLREGELGITSVMTHLNALINLVVVTNGLDDFFGRPEDQGPLGPHAIDQPFHYSITKAFEGRVSGRTALYLQLRYAKEGWRLAINAKRDTIAKGQPGFEEHVLADWYTVFTLTPILSKESRVLEGMAQVYYALENTH